MKLDRTLIAEIDGPDGVDALAAVRTLCELGAALDLGVVAEGVERTEQVVLLQEAGCTVAQGVLLGIPRSVEEIGPDLTAGELGPVQPVAAVPALGELVEFTGEPVALVGEEPPGGGSRWTPARCSPASSGRRGSRGRGRSPSPCPRRDRSRCPSAACGPRTCAGCWTAPADRGRPRTGWRCVRTPSPDVAPLE